jgi:hypothetical protein
MRLRSKPLDRVFHDSGIDGLSFQVGSTIEFNKLLGDTFRSQKNVASSKSEAVERAMSAVSTKPLHDRRPFLSLAWPQHVSDMWISV